MKDDFKIPSRTVFTDESLNTIFMNQGYVVIRDFVSQSSCKTLNQWYEKNPPEHSSGFHTSIHSTNVNHRRAVTQEVRKSFDEPLIELLSNYRPVFSSFTVKEPDSSSGFDIHLDWSMVDEQRFTSLTAWVPLIDITNDNGYLWVLPESHKFYPTIRGGPGLNLWCKVPPTQWQKQFQLKKLKLRKGDALIYDHRLFHGSPPNNTQHRRLAINHTLIPLEAKSLHYQFTGHGQVDALEVPDDFYHTHILNTLPSLQNSVWSKKIGGSFIFQHAVNKLISGESIH